MYDKPMLSLDQVRKAMDTMLNLATKSPDQPLAIAIVDDQGSLVSYARMDRCRLIPQRMAIRKAYTCAVTGQDSQAYAERLASQGRSVAEIRDEHQRSIPMGRVGTAVELADVVTFICSSRASFVTGTDVRVDGGAVRGF